MGSSVCCEDRSAMDGVDCWKKLGPRTIYARFLTSCIWQCLAEGEMRKWKPFEVCVPALCLLRANWYHSQQFRTKCCVCVCVCLLVDPRFGIFLSLSISYFLSIWEEQRLWLLLPSSPGKCTGGAGARQTANDICNKVFRNHHPHFVLVRFSYRKKPAWKSHNRKLGAKINKLQKLDDALG